MENLVLIVLNAAALIISSSINLSAREVASTPLGDLVMQDGPGAIQLSEAVQCPPAGIVSGTIRDIRGAELMGAQVRLVGQDNDIDRSLISDGKGAYSFDQLPAGTYTVKITAAGVDSFASGPVVIGPGEKRELP